MKIKLKRVARLGDHVHNIGEHEIDEKHANHWYFKALVADKDLEILDSEDDVDVKGSKVKSSAPKIMVPEGNIDFSKEEKIEEPKKSKKSK